jgi:membrane protease YdiL (CAAX protease family)
MEILDAVPENEVAPVKHYPTLLQSLGLIGIWLIATLVVVLVLMPFLDVTSGIGLFLSYTLSMSLAVFAGFALRKNYTLEFVGFPIGIAVLSSLLMIPLHIAIDPIVSLFPVPESLKNIMEGIYENPVASIATIAIAAPLLEEILFRGIILHGLLKNYSAGIAIAFSSLLFALIHGNVAQGLGAFLMGLFMGWIYWKTKSLYIPIILHFVNNTVSCVGMFVMPQEQIDTNLIDIIANDQLYYALVVGSILFCVAGVLFIQKKYFSEHSFVNT